MMIVALLAKVTLLFGLAWGVTALMRRHSAAQRHGVWACAAAIALVLPVLTALPGWAVLPWPAASAAATLPTQSETDNAAAAVVHAPPSSAIPHPNPAPVAALTDRIDTADEAGDLATGPLPPAEPSEEGLAPRFAPAMVGLWALGALLLGARLAWGSRTLYRIAAAARALTDPRLLEHAADAQSRLGLRRQVRLLIGADAAGAMTWGILRPTVILPADAAGWSDLRSKAVLTHELAHIARFDCAVQWIVSLTRMVYWFHPLAWVAARHVHLEQERAADDHVLQTGAQPSGYATELLALATRGSAQRIPAFATAMARPSELLTRIESLLEGASRPRGWSCRARRATLGVSLGIALATGSLRPAAPAPRPTDGDGARSATPDRGGRQLRDEAPQEAQDKKPGKKQDKKPKPGARSPRSRPKAQGPTAPLSAEVISVLLEDTIQDGRLRGDDLRAFRAQAMKSRRELLGFGERAVPALVTILASDRQEEVRAARAILTEMGRRPRRGVASAIQEALLAVITDPTKGARHRRAAGAALAAQAHARPEAIAAVLLRAEIGHPLLAARLSPKVAQSEAVVGWIRETLRDATEIRSESVRGAVEALEKMGTTEIAVGIYRSLLTHSVDELVLEAIRRLTRTSAVDADTAAAIAHLKKHRNPRIVRACVAFEDARRFAEQFRVHQFLVCDYSENRIIGLGADGREVFSLNEMFGVWDAEQLANGNLLVTEFAVSRIIEVTRKGEIVWKFEGVKNPYDADRLGNGNTLIADTFGHRVIEVNPAGKIVWEFSENIRPYDADRLANGHTLIADPLGDRVMEVDPTGKVVWELKDVPNVHDADRLANGNTLVTIRMLNEVREVDPKGRTVMTLKNLVSPSDADRLPNGMTLVAENGRVAVYNGEGVMVWKKEVTWAVEANASLLGRKKPNETGRE